MTVELNWQSDTEEIFGTDVNAQIAVSGEVEVGNVHQSKSGRWRWEIVLLPDTSAWQEDRKGWKETEDEAKAVVQDLWSRWCKRAGLVGTDEMDPVDRLAEQVRTKHYQGLSADEHSG